MKINKGDTLEEISLPKPDGSIFNLSETKGKKVLLTFYRIAGCSFSKNIHRKFHGNKLHKYSSLYYCRIFRNDNCFLYS